MILRPPLPKYWVTGVSPRPGLPLIQPTGIITFWALVFFPDSCGVLEECGPAQTELLTLCHSQWALWVHSPVWPMPPVGNEAG